jgi:type IX secretion system PorP/SprF family membrane protein
MTLKKNIVGIALMVLGCISSHAQQEAVSSQFLMNKLFINPGYAGYKEQPNISLVHRSQWIGFKGAPMSTIITFDTPLKKNELAIGGSAFFDKLGPQSRVGVQGNFAYRTRLSNRATLSWGASVSLDVYQANLVDLALTSDYNGVTDDAFLYNVKGLLLPNVGFGAYYFKKDHYIGISAPKMLRPRMEKRDSPLYDVLVGRQEATVFLMGGKMFKINKDLQIQANILARGVWNAPMSIGLYTNMIIYKNFTVGAFYHYRETVGLLGQWQINKQTKVGYSFDLPTSVLIRNNWGSHELALNYILPTKKKRIVYPRYF